MINGTPLWNKRSSMFFEKYPLMSVLVFMIEDNVILNDKLDLYKYMEDWRHFFIGDLVKTLQYNDLPNASIVPIIHSWDLEDANDNVPSLTKLLNITREDSVPGIYLLHMPTKKV